MTRIAPVLLDEPRLWCRTLDVVGCDQAVWERVRERRDVLTFLTGPVCQPGASIVKQSMLAGGADALVHRAVLTCGVPESRLLLCGTEKTLRAGCESLKRQPFGLPLLAEAILSALSVPDAPDRMVFPGGSLEFRFRPLMMGVLNVTPDSFSDGGLWETPESAVEHGLSLVRQGADLLDVGGESTRPGASPTPPEQQISRVVPVIRELRRHSEVPISIDTTHPAVARAALETGAGILNSVNGMSTEGMAELASESGAAVILMHIRGEPATMQEAPHYEDPVSEVAGELLDRIAHAVRCGVPRDRILVDPGIGFGKRPWDNLRLIQNTPWLRRVTGCRVVLGHSRKSILGLLTREPDPARRDAATALVSALSVGRADVLRVHNVAESLRAVTEAMEGAGG